MEEYLNIYKDYRKKIKAYNYINYIVSWDSETEAPNGCFEARGKHLGVFAEEAFKLQTSDEYVNAVEKLLEKPKKLDKVLLHELTEVKRSNDELKKIPMEEYVNFQVLLSNSQTIWAKAKTTNDFSVFAPTLKEIIAFMKKYVKYLETDTLKGYDVLLDQYEHDYTQKEYDAFFDLLKEKLVPFVKNVTSKKLEYDSSFVNLKYPKEKQKAFCKYIEDVMCFDHERGLSKESEHPFTSGSGTTDVRYTNHFYEDLFYSSIFSAIHELGHATYEQQSDPSLDDTFSGGGASMAMHESQSRFYENIVGRSYEFWQRHYPKLQKTFPKNLKNVSLDSFYKLINNSTCSLIRTEADELTYPIHIMIRYDIEKMIFNNEVEVEDLPKVWNQKIKDYLGLDVPSDDKGVLQDIHWAGGSFGYFPTYALGSAYSAQFYNAMKKDLDVSKAFGEKTTKKVNKWLKNKIHKYGATLYPKEIILKATGESFNPEYYIEYLISKYSKIYGLTNE